MDFEILAKAKFRQADFAYLCGVSRVTVNLWVNKKMAPNRFLADRVASVLAAVQMAYYEKKLPTTSKTRPALGIVKAILESREAETVTR